MVVAVGEAVIVAVGVSARHHHGVLVGQGVLVGVGVGVLNGVGVRIDARGYSSSIASSQLNPSVKANSVYLEPG